MELDTLRDAFDRVTKRQKLSSSLSYQVVDHVDNEIRQALIKMQSGQDPIHHVDPKQVLIELKKKCREFGIQNQLEGAQKELNVSLSRYLKLLEKYLYPDISKAYRNVDFDRHLVNRIVASHLFHHGLFDIGDYLVTESGDMETEVMMLRSQFLEMHQIREAMKVKNLQPALDWVSANREKLKQSSSDIELKLHQLQFVEILKRGTRTEAFSYARAYIAAFACSHMDEIQKCMSCLLWIGKLDSCPYVELLAPENWDKVTEELCKQFYNVCNLSQKSPLAVTTEAGAQGLPILLKLSTLMAARAQEWEVMKQLPVPLDLGREFQFHSVFVCPVSRDQVTEENSAMMLPCGHVLCRQSILKLSKNNTRTFKCPYCPHQASVMQCRQLHF